MKVKVLQDEKENFVFKVSGTGPWLTNLLRRYVLAHVPTFAIDKVTFYENDSYMFDEYIAHRIGLIPLKTPVNASKNEEVVFTLDVQGPKVVMSGDLRTKSKDIRPLYDNIPIIQLREGQVLRLEGVARLGEPHNHQKFQAGLASYEYDDPGEITFFVESYGNYPMAHDIVKVAIKLIKNKIREYNKMVKSLNK